MPEAVRRYPYIVWVPTTASTSTRVTFNRSDSTYLYYTTMETPTRMEQKGMSINSIEQLDALDPASIVSLARPGVAPETWQKRPDGRWTNVESRRGALMSRHFRGAVQGGLLTVASRGRGGTEAAATDDWTWQRGAMYYDSSNYTLLYCFAEQEGNRAHNAMQVESNMRISTLRMRLNDYRTSGSWFRVRPDQMPREGAYSAIAMGFINTLLNSVPAKLPEALTADLTTLVATGENGPLMEVLKKHNIDVSVMTKARVEGTSKVKGEDIAFLLGVSTPVESDLTTPWATEFDTPVVPGCICDKQWGEVVADMTAFASSIPEDYESLTVVLTCPIHPNGQ